MFLGFGVGGGVLGLVVWWFGVLVWNGLVWSGFVLLYWVWGTWLVVVGLGLGVGCGLGVDT